MAHAVAFLGPSLLHPEIPLGIEVMPPARRGDVLHSVRQGAGIVGLIDGIVVSELAVTPDELRQSHALGARLLGGASLGALRAVECPDVIEGIGEVYEIFRQGLLSDDDELVGTFDETYRTIAFPLIVVRDRIAACSIEGAISQNDANIAIQAVKALPYHERTLAHIAHVIKGKLGSTVANHARARLLSTDDDIKARDARLVLAAIKQALR